MRSISVLDPGHGGTTTLGGSTPYGIRGLNGLVEKNVTLDLAQRVARRMGTAVVLTRHGDVNVSLADRTQLSSEFASPVFLSIHATAGGAGQHGFQSWVHASAGPASVAFAEEVRGELARIGINDGGVRRGKLALLNPARHQHGCAACLIEVEHLDDEDGARRLGTASDLDAIADGLARAIERHLSRGGTYGRRPSAYGRKYARTLSDELDLTDFPTNVFTVIPNAGVPTVPRQIRESDHTALEVAWDCMMKNKGLTLEGTAADQRDFRVLLRGGLADSPFIRGLFQEIACDDAHPLTMHCGRSQEALFVDGFQFDPTQGSVAAGLNQAGHHTIDLDDFDMLPHVSGNPRNNMMLSQQNLVHVLREARQGVLGDAFPVAHVRAIDDENLYRQEQGQIGVLSHAQPVAIGTSLMWNFTHNGVVQFFETWRLGGNVNILSIDYSP